MEAKNAEVQRVTLTQDQIRCIDVEIDAWCLDNAERLIEMPHQLGNVKELLKARISELGGE